MSETIGNQRYVRERRTVLTPLRSWKPNQPQGAWVPLTGMDVRPPETDNPQSSQSVRVWLVGRDGKQAEGFFCDWLGWQVRNGTGPMDFDDAVEGAFIGWRVKQ